MLASNYGALLHPAWHHNLLANPNTTIEIGDAIWDVHAREATSSERRTLLELMVTTTPGVGAAVRKTARQLPVIVLDLVTKPTQDRDELSRRPHFTAQPERTAS